MASAPIPVSPAPDYSTLEVVPDDPGKQVIYSPFSKSPSSPMTVPSKDAAATAAATAAASVSPVTSPARICRLPKRTFLILLGLTIVLIAAIIGGAVGGVVSHNNKSSSSSSSSTSATPTSTGLTLHPDSKLTSTFLTVTSSLTREFLFFQDLESTIHCAVYASDNKVWSIYSVQDGTSASGSAATPAPIKASAGTSMAAAVAYDEVHLFYLTTSGALAHLRSSGGRLWTIGTLSALAEKPINGTFATTRLAASGDSLDQGPALAYVVQEGGADKMRVAVQNGDSYDWNTTTGFTVASSYNAGGISTAWFDDDVIGGGVGVFTQNAENITMHQFNVSKMSFVQDYIFPYTPQIAHLDTYNFLPTTSNPGYTNLQLYILLDNGTLTTQWETGGIVSDAFVTKTSDPVDLAGAGMSNQTWSAMTSNDNFNFYGVHDGRITQYTMDTSRQTWSWVTDTDVNW